MINIEEIEKILKNLFTDKYDFNTKMKALGHLEIEELDYEYIEKYYPEFIDKQNKEIKKFMLVTFIGQDNKFLSHYIELNPKLKKYLY